MPTRFPVARIVGTAAAAVAVALTATTAAADSPLPEPIPHTRASCNAWKLNGGGAAKCLGLGLVGNFRVKVTCRKNMVNYVRLGPWVGNGKISSATCSPLVGTTVSSVGTEVNNGS